MPLMDSPNKERAVRTDDSCTKEQLFSSLPAYVQETVMQSGVADGTETELKKCAENMMKPQNGHTGR